MRASLFFLFFFVFLPSPLFAQEGYSLELKQAEHLLAGGKRARARNAFEDILDAYEEEAPGDRPSPRERVRALRGIARINLQTGRYEEALVVLERARKISVDPWTQLLEARVRSRLGQYEKSISLVRPLLETKEGERSLELECLFRLSRWQKAIGRKNEARVNLKKILKIGAGNPLEEARDLLWYAKAMIAIGGGENLQQASALLIEATKKNPRLAPAYVARGDLLFLVYREARGYPSGESEYKRALRFCGEVEDALVGLFRTRKDNFLLDYGKTLRFLGRALALNPRSVSALVAKGSGRINDRAFESARRLLQKALSVNPRDKTALAEMAAVSYLTYRKTDYSRFRKKVKVLDQNAFLVDSILGKHMVALYRFPESLPLFANARRERPEDYDTLIASGRGLIYSGKVNEGAQFLEASKKVHPGFVHPWRDNQLLLQKRIDEEYERFPKGNFLMVMKPQEKGVLLPYLSLTYEKAWRELGLKYGVYPDCKVRVEDFERFGDFSVRTIGYQGFGALGACFGCFITSVSPTAPELRTQFSWRVTARHEFSHVLHLMLSRGRVPRWLTEGLAVFEELAMDPSNDRRMERELFTYWKNGEVFPVSELNTAFRGPTILFGYYQGGLIVRHIARDFGFPKLVEIVKAFGKDMGTEAIFRKVLGIPSKEYDRRFLNFVASKVGHLRLVPSVHEKWLQRLLERVEINPKDVEARLLLAQAFSQRHNEIDAGTQIAALKKIDPNNGGVYLLRARLALGRRDYKGARKLFELGFSHEGDDFDSRMAYSGILEKAGRTKKALEQVEKAIACWPTCPISGNGSPFASKARLLKAMGKKEEALQTLETYVRFNARDYGVFRHLAREFRARGKVAKEKFFLMKARDIDPFDRALHERLAEIFLKEGNDSRALFLLQIALETPLTKDRSSQKRRPPQKGVKVENPTTVEARIRIRIAEILRSTGDLERAMKMAKKAKQLKAPLSSEFQERLKELLK
jgi:tetratricopeptide (TPR) repeat protein